MYLMEILFFLIGILIILSGYAYVIDHIKIESVRVTFLILGAFIIGFGAIAAILSFIS
jgi:hypothetical protein